MRVDIAAKWKNYILSRRGYRTRYCNNNNNQQRVSIILNVLGGVENQYFEDYQKKKRNSEITYTERTGVRRTVEITSIAVFRVLKIR